MSDNSPRAASNNTSEAEAKALYMSIICHCTEVDKGEPEGPSIIPTYVVFEALTKGDMRERERILTVLLHLSATRHEVKPLPGTVRRHIKRTVITDQVLLV